MSTKVNAGIYLFNVGVLTSGRIKAIPSSLEKDILPTLAHEGNLFCIKLDSFWMDIGLPHNYLLGTQLFLQHMQEMQIGAEGNQAVVSAAASAESKAAYKVFDGEKSFNLTLADGPNIIGSVLIHPSA